jgi:hypothetical protein
MNIPPPTVSLPKSVSDWMTLPELPMGRRYYVGNFGAKMVDLAEVRNAGVKGLPEVREAGSRIIINTVVVFEDDRWKAFRLHPDFAPCMQRLFEDAGRAHAAGTSLLPWTFEFGMRADGAYVIPDGATTGGPAMTQ